MGYYINPKDMTKEEFLEKNGTRVNIHDVVQRWRSGGVSEGTKRTDRQ